MSVFWDLAYLTGYAPWDRGEPTKELVELVESGAIKPCRIIDIGCGTGSNVVFLATKGFEAHGLDVSKVALLKAKRKAEEDGVTCFFYHMDFRDTTRVSELGFFDLAIDVGCYHSLAHGNDRICYVNSLNKVLRRGGEYLLWCFVKERSPSWGPTGVGKNEVEQRLGGTYTIIQKRRINTPLREILFYHMRKEV
ncbi:MAG: class I SAM-dependent methyltransferase [Candidatus Caldarchaeum sp.]